MIRVDYNTTLKELLSAKLMSSETYYSLLSHYRSFSEFTNLADIKVVYNNLKKNNNFPNKSIEEIADIFKLINLSPYITLKELLDNGYISVRTYNVLRYNPSLEYTDNTIIAQIKKDFSNPSDLLKLRNFGKKSFFELNNVLSLIPDVSSTVVVEQNIGESNNDIDELIYEVINSSYDIAFSDENAYTLFIRKLYPTAEDIHHTILRDYSILFSIYREFDINGNTIIRQYFLDYIREVLQCFKEVETSHIGIYTVYAQSENELSQAISIFSFTDRYRYFLDDFKREYIRNYYISLCDTSISVRTKHFIDKFLPTFDDFLPYVDKDSVFILDKLSKFINRTSKTLVEIIDICSKVRDKFLEVEISENSIIRTNTLKEKYPYLIYKQREFVVNYQNKYKTLPHFYLLYQYLYAVCCSNDNKNRTIRIFCSHNGLIGLEKKNLDEIAKEHRLTRERIRQLSTFKEINKILSEYFPIDVSFYSELLNKQYFFSNDPEYHRIRKNQNLAFDFKTFGMLYCIYTGFEYINFKGVEIVYSNNLFKTNCLEKNLEAILYKSSMRIIQDERTDITTYISKSSKYFEEEKKLLFLVFEYLNIANIRFEGNSIVFKQNSIDVTTELAKILEKKGEPMFLQDLFIAFKSKYPKHKLETAEKLRPYIKKPLKAVGKQSKYGLETWENIYWGSIRDLLIDCLEKSNLPIHIDELTNEVLVHYPNTNAKNILSTLSSDEFDRFVHFNGGYFGLEWKVYPEKYIRASVVRRYNFSERFEIFRDFIESYHRFPFSNGGEMESSLQRWYNNVLSGAIEVTNEEINELSNSINYYESLNYPKNAFEANFLNKCEDLKSFILENHCLPSPTNGKELYWWLRQSKENMNSYTDKRRLYFLDLLSYISSFGFSI